MAFGLKDVLGHAAYLLLIGASLARSVLPLRLLAIGSGSCSIVYSVLMHDRPGLMWESIFTLINVGQAILLVVERRGARLTDEERDLHGESFPQLSVVDFHRLLRAGTWRSAAAGEVLASQGRALTCVVLLVDGVASVTIDGQVVAYRRHGDWIGEMAFVSGNPAAATVEITEPSRYVMWHSAKLKVLVDRHPEIRSALELLLSRNLVHKLRTIGTGRP